MAWETREGKAYYYQKKWVNGTCQSRYVGAGELGRIAATLDELTTIERRRLRKEREAQAAIDREINALGDLVRAYSGAVLLLAGYHTHRRQWRKKR